MILILKHLVSEGPGLLADFLESKKFKLKIIELANGQTIPSNLGKAEAVISMGGPMNVDEEEKYPFLREEDKFLKKVIKEGTPFLGICLGAQLLAKAQGAAIKKGSCKEAGWFKVNLTEQGRADTLFSGLSKELDVFQWHEDEFQVPAGGVLLAEGIFCRNQAFRLAKNAYGLQFHIEATPSMVEAWLGDDLNGNDLAKRNEAEKIIGDTYEKNAQFLKQANKIFANFYRIIERFLKKSK